ncbi:hypothetical protein F0562_031308 [Nyssa sinensis]|uniref:Subtilisin-like protease fibronectin type-III domain-containing protein n=1 Tax=Nyssa sinensis TaxID=561372 RepID=A0A5J5AXT6_9ASTE|nr:hypothetical protein F0562_031308 [Nyssa sinensis]
MWATSWSCDGGSLARVPRIVDPNRLVFLLPSLSRRARGGPHLTFWVLVGLLLFGRGDEKKTGCQADTRPSASCLAGDRLIRLLTRGRQLHLPCVLRATSAKDSLIYSYQRSFNGFAAKLSDEEVARFSEMEGVVSVLPNSMLQLHTTRSWDFMGFTESYVGDSQGGDVIVGLLDSGIWPESDSFRDDGYGPPPAKWKGTCQTENNFTCNNKIIGAQYYNSENFYYTTDIKSPRDTEGHGTHTGSTAAGRKVAGASYYGLAEGLARGGNPSARIAVYKVCWAIGCATADILAAFDDAIADGVNIISVSLGASFPLQYFEDPIAIGSFHAMKYGILTSNSAGNDGPWRGGVSNYSPWSLTVAANTIDRKFVSQLVLGNGQIFNGIAINNFELNGTSFPLIWGGDAANFSANALSLDSRYCFPGEMDSRKVKGKIVLCEGFWDGSGILLADGLGIIMPTQSFNDFAFSFPLSATLISQEDITKVLEYIRSSKNPIATILGGGTWKDIMAPSVVSFSSRGPNPITSDILKPDLTAPGVDILAAWSPIAPPSVYSEDTRRVKYNIISGTSMSCPHASGAAAYVKATHPSWSPAAIKSALMTTAHVMDPRKHDDREFAYGSGHINPVNAVNPGLIFDISEADYIDLLCKQGYNITTLRLVTGDNSVCNNTKPSRAWDLNYPSFSLAIEDGQKIMGTFTRTVTNVGSPNSTYYASMYMPNSIDVKVEPSVLSFSAIGDRKSFTVKVSGPQITQEPIISGSILWKDGVNVVRTPLVVYTVIPSALSSYSSPSGRTNKSAFKGVPMNHKKGLLQWNDIPTA